MWKSILAGTTALMIAGSSLVYAQEQPAGPDGARRWQPTAADVSAFADARIAGLKAGLKLTPDQEKDWPAVESAIRDLSKQRADRLAARASAPRTADPIERMSLRADAMTQIAAGLKKLADAARPLYQKLDEGQKHRFLVLVHSGGHEFGHGGWHHNGSRGTERGEGGPGRQ